MRAVFRFRLRIILAVVVSVGLVLVGRLYFLQVVNGEEYALKADRQYAAGGNSLFGRGTISFTRKDGSLVSAASLATGFLIAVNPQVIDDREAVYAALAPLVGDLVREETFFKAVRSEKAVYVEIAHRVPEEVGRAVSEADIDGVVVLRERWRSYPGGTLAAQTIGTVARTALDDTLRGRTGLEARYEETLARDGDGLYRNFFAEIFANVSDALGAPDAAREGNLITTLEPEVETRLMAELALVHEKYRSHETGGVIMDPKTGAILAIASYPTYDANDSSAVPVANFTNPFTSRVYEFGSIVKPLTMAAALDAGVVQPNSVYTDKGCLTLDTSTICNFDKKARGTVPMQEILSQSLNVGAAYLAKRLGGTGVREYFTKLGFGEKTGIDLPAETTGLISNLSSPREIEFATAAFGQGIAVTPLAMVRALGALANGGAIVRPYIGSAVKLDSGITRSLVTEEGRVQVFSPEATREVAKMLTRVVDHNLSKGTLASPTFSIAAKTGTAQLTEPGGGYSQSRFFHSFFGYFPSYDPRFIILLYTHDPQGVQYASETLSDTFMDLAHFLIEYYEVPPDRTAIPEI